MTIFSHRKKFIRVYQYFKNYQLLAKIYYDNKKYELAKQVLDQALLMEPANMQTLRDSVEIYSVLKQYSEVINKCEVILQHNPQNIKFNLVLAKNYLITNQLEKCHLQLENASKIQSENPDIYIIWGQLYQKQNDFNQAIESYQKSLHLNYPHKAQILSLIAQVQVQQGNIPSAIAYYQKALQLKPRNQYLKQILHNLQNQSEK